MQQCKECLEELVQRSGGPRALFTKLGASGHGALTRTEFAALFRLMRPPLSATQQQMMLSVLAECATDAAAASSPSSPSSLSDGVSKTNERVDFARFTAWISRVTQQAELDERRATCFPEWLRRRPSFQAAMDQRDEPWLQALRLAPQLRSPCDLMTIVRWLASQRQTFACLGMPPELLAQAITLCTYEPPKPGAHSATASASAGAKVMSEGETDTLYVVLHGRCVAHGGCVRKGTRIALGPGERFGALQRRLELRSCDVHAAEGGEGGGDVHVLRVARAEFAAALHARMTRAMRLTDVFRSWSVTRCRELAAKMEHRLYVPGTAVFRQGERADGIHIVVSGELLVEKELWTVRRNRWPLGRVQDAVLSVKARRHWRAMKDAFVLLNRTGALEKKMKDIVATMPATASTLEEHTGGGNDDGRRALGRQRVGDLVWEGLEHRSCRRHAVAVLRGVTVFGATRCLAPYPKNVRANTVSAATMALLWFLPKAAFIEATMRQRDIFQKLEKRANAVVRRDSIMTANLMQAAAAGSAVSKRLTQQVAAGCAVGRLDDVVVGREALPELVVALHRRGSKDLVTPMVRKDTRHLAEKAAVAIASHGMGKTAMSTAAEDLEAAEKGQSSAGAKFMARAEMEKRHNQQSALAEARKMQEQLWTGTNGVSGGDSGDELGDSDGHDEGHDNQYGNDKGHDAHTAASIPRLSHNIQLHKSRKRAMQRSRTFASVHGGRDASQRQRQRAQERDERLQARRCRAFALATANAHRRSEAEVMEMRKREQSYRDKRGAAEAARRMNGATVSFHLNKDVYLHAEVPRQNRRGSTVMGTPPALRADIGVRKTKRGGRVVRAANADSPLRPRTTDGLPSSATPANARARPAWASKLETDVGHLCSELDVAELKLQQARRVREQMAKRGAPRASLRRHLRKTRTFAHMAKSPGRTQPRTAASGAQAQACSLTYSGSQFFSHPNDI